MIAQRLVELAGDLSNATRASREKGGLHHQVNAEPCREWRGLWSMTKTANLL